MRAVWKFPLDVADEQIIEWPAFTTPLCVQVQHGSPCIWADVETTQSPDRRRIVIKGTGHNVAVEGGEEDGASLVYLGTFQLYSGAYVGHVFVDSEDC